jgi:classical protein kinase C/novel protein kinase C epsilon type
MDGDDIIASVYRKIEREKALITAASNMRQSTNNPLVQQRVDANIRDGRKNIAYLEEKMRELQLRRDGGSPTDKRLPPDPAGGPAPPPKDFGQGHAGNEEYDGSGPYPQGGSGSMPTGAPFRDPRPFAPVPKARPNFTKLGMLHRSPTDDGGIASIQDISLTLYFVQT